MERKTLKIGDLVFIKKEPDVSRCICHTCANSYNGARGKEGTIIMIDGIAERPIILEIKGLQYKKSFYSSEVIKKEAPNYFKNDKT